MKKAAKRKTTKFYVALFLAITILIIFSNFEDKPLKGFADTVTRPFSKFFSNSARYTNEKISFFSSIGTLKKENESLLEENLKLKSKISFLQDIKKENAQLREQLELAPRDKYFLKPTLVIGHSIDGASEEFMIDLGSSHGIKEQMSLIVNEGVLVGKIKKTFHSTSLVEPIVSRNSRVNVEVVESNAKGIVRGQFGTSATLEMIPQNIEINRGDTVITSGVGKIVPRGLLVGYSQDPIPTADQLFQQATLTLPVHYEDIRMAWVVLDSQNK